MKKILVPGAGYGQEIIIKKARDMGLFVIVVSPKGDYPGLEHGDKIYFEDVRNKERILDIAKSEKIDGIVSDQNDIPVETIGYVTEHLCLTGNDHATSRLFTQKNLMRKKCAEIGVPTIVYHIAECVEDAFNIGAEIGYPVMCKPVDNQSSKGVFKANSAEELRKNFSNSLAQSFSNKVIIEKFVEGKEYVIEGVAIDGLFKNLLLLERTYFKKKDVFIPSMVTAPTALSVDKSEELLHLNKKICTSMGLRYGLSHSEFILNTQDDKFYLVETAARGGGVFTSSHLLSYACNMDTSKLIVDLCIGKKRDIERLKFATKAVRYVCFYVEKGKIKAINGIESIKSMPGVLDFFDKHLSKGAICRGIVDKSSRLGPILLGARNLYEIERLTKKVRDTLVIETDRSRNAVIWE